MCICSMEIDVQKRLKKIFFERFEMDYDTLGPKYLDKDIMGFRIRFLPRDLLTLFFVVEEEFGICIPQEAIIAERFRTFNDICDIVMEQLGNEQEKNCI